MRFGSGAYDVLETESDGVLSSYGAPEIISPGSAISPKRFRQLSRRFTDESVGDLLPFQNAQDATISKVTPVG